MINVIKKALSMLDTGAPKLTPLIDFLRAINDTHLTYKQNDAVLDYILALPEENNVPSTFGAIQEEAA
jgi:hypothetical protein